MHFILRISKIGKIICNLSVKDYYCWSYSGWNGKEISEEFDKLTKYINIFLRLSVFFSRVLFLEKAIIYLKDFIV